MPKVNPLHYALGVHGFAVLRYWSSGGAVAERAVNELLAFGSKLSTDSGSLQRDLVERDVQLGYAEWSATYDQPPNPLIALEEPVVHAIVDELPIGHALDAACGTGRHARYLQERGFRVTGVDGSPEMLAIARAKVPGADFRLGDLNRLDISDGYFDVVVCALALEHFDDINCVVAELARVTRRGGTIVISTFHPFSQLTGGGAFYRTADGGYRIVRGQLRAVSQYVGAFLAAGLEIFGCVEPAWDERAVAMLGSAALAPDIYRLAITGTPCAMIWSLRRR